MGVDFSCGSMSYPKYDNLIAAIAKCFHGIPNIYIPDDTDKVFYPFGFIEAGDNSDVKEKFTFSGNIPTCISKLCNNPYGDLTKEEVKALYEILTGIENILSQDIGSSVVQRFIRELKYCIDNDEDWYID